MLTNILVWCSIHGVCDSNNEEMLLFLLEHGSDLNLIADSEKCTPLQHAAKEGNLPLVKRFLELGADINGPHGSDGSTIHYALSSSDPSIVTFFLDAGVDIVDSEPGQSTLCKALRLGMKELLPVLLEKGADANHSDFGTTALGIAFKRDDEEAVQLLLDHGAVWTEAGPIPLLNAAKRRELGDVRRLLDYGVDPNGSTTYETPLGVS